MDEARKAHWAAQPTHEYLVPVPPKTLAEVLSVAQAALHNYETITSTKYAVALEVIELLLNETSQMRPVGPDGKHGNKHTGFCGCEDKTRVELCPETVSYIAALSEWQVSQLKNLVEHGVSHGVTFTFCETQGSTKQAPFYELEI